VTEALPHNLDPADEALLTAYALGECDSAADRAAAERLLAGDPAARRAADGVRAVALILADGLKGEPDVGLTAIHVAGIERRLAADAEADAPHPVPLPLRRNWGLWGSVAASTLIVATVMATVLPQVFRESSRAGPPRKGGVSGDGSIAAAPEAGTPREAGTSAGAGGLLSPPPRPTVPPAPTKRGAGPAAAGRSATPATGRSSTRRPASCRGRPCSAASPGCTSRRSSSPGDFPLAVVPPTPAHPNAVDAGTVAALRSALAAGQLPAPHRVRADELVNHLKYDDLPPGASPLVAKVESAVCPWNSGHLLVRVTVRNHGYSVAAAAEDDDAAADGSAADPATAAATSPTVPASPIAPLVRDLRLAVEVNPAAVAGYRVIGYENGPRTWGEWAGRDDHEVVPAGTTFTALLEVVPVGQSLPESTKPATPMRYGRPPAAGVVLTELLTVGVEYRQGRPPTRSGWSCRCRSRRRRSSWRRTDFRAAAGAAALGLSLRQPDPSVHPALEAAIKLLADVTATRPADGPPGAAGDGPAGEGRSGRAASRGRLGRLLERRRLQPRRGGRCIAQGASLWVDESRSIRAPKGRQNERRSTCVLSPFGARVFPASSTQGLRPGLCVCRPFGAEALAPPVVRG
jgi:hypothetical protein